MKNIRRTSIETYHKIKAEGLLSKKRQEVYDVLFESGPGTAMELRRFFPKGTVDSQIRARLNELRQMGCAYEVRERPCTITGQTVIEWDVTPNLPTKLDKPKKVKCKTCDGRGYHVTQQSRFDI